MKHVHTATLVEILADERAVLEGWSRPVTIAHRSRRGRRLFFCVVPVCTVETDKRILLMLDEPAPKGYARWSAPLLSDALGDVSDQYIWRFLRAQKMGDL